MENNICIYGMTLMSLLFLISCNPEPSDTTVAELKELRHQVLEDSLFRENWAVESREIDSLLSRIAGFTNTAQDGLLEDQDLLTKAISVETIVEEVNEKIAQLEKEIEIKEQKAKRLPNLVQNIKQQKRMLTEQDSIIKSLQQKVEAGDLKIEKLGSKINLQDKTIEEQETSINNKIAELHQKEQALMAKQRELEETKKKSIADLKKQKNSFHIGAGLDRIKIVDLAKGMAPKKKQQILSDAWDHFCKAHLAGDYNALTEMEKLKTSASLGRFVRNKNCE